MNLTTTKFETITSDTIKYSNPTDLSVKTQDEKVQLTKAVDKEARLFVDATMTTRILDIADEAERLNGQEYAREYLNKAKGVVSDALGKIDRRVNLLATTTVVEAETVEDERVSKLQTTIDKQKAESAKMYEDGISERAVLASDLKKANDVISKLQDGEDITQALKEVADLKGKLGEAEDIASQVNPLKNDIDAKTEAIASAKTFANGLKRQLALKEDAIRNMEKEVDNKTGEALLTLEQKTETKALVAVEIAKKIRFDYPLQTFLIQNGMTEEEIKLATSATQRTLYDTEDVENIASIIYNERNAVSDSTIVDKIEALVQNAITTIAKADTAHRYESLKNTWTMTVRGMTDDAVAK